MYFGSRWPSQRKRVAVVGAGISAVQHLKEISGPEYEAQTFWYTRRPQWSRHFDGRDTVSRVAEDVEAGNPSGSIVSYTGLYEDAPYITAARERGALRRRQMLQRITPRGVVGASGAFTELDAIVWATGFGPSQSTVGANRAGRDAVISIKRELDSKNPAEF